MQRRLFLKAVAKAVSCAGIQTFLVNQARARPPRCRLERAACRWGRGGPFRSSPLVRVQLHSLQSADPRDGRRPLRHGAHTSSAGWAGAAPSPEPGGMVLRYRGTSGLPGRRAKVTDACWGVFTGSAPCATIHFPQLVSAPSRMLIAFCPAGKMEQYFRRR